jgi:hypothetical protein
MIRIWTTLLRLFGKSRRTFMSYSKRQDTKEAGAKEVFLLDFQAL